MRSEFQQSVLELLSRSRRSLALADNDFSDWPLESPQAFSELSRLLKEPDAGLRLVVHSPDWLERHAPRFAQLRRSFSGRIECRQAPATLAAGEGLLLGDRMHFLRRAHYQAFRGRILLAMPESVEPPDSVSGSSVPAGAGVGSSSQRVPASATVIVAV